MSSFDPNAQFFASHRPTETPTNPAAPSGAPTHAPSSYATTPRTPTWVKVLIGLGCAIVAFVLLAIVAAVAVPVFLNERAKATDTAVKTDLQNVATAEQNYWAANGTYTADPQALGITEPASHVAILAADTQGFCLGGRAADGDSQPWYYSSAATFSREGC